MQTYKDQSPVFSRTPAVRRTRHEIYADTSLRQALLGIRQRIADMLGMFPAEDRVNSYYGHTQDGLVLDCSYGNPSRILSPWGQFDIHRGGTSKEPDWLNLLDDLKLSEVAPRMYIDNPMYGGEKGPLYTIGNFNGPLPAACFDLQASAVTGWHGSLSFELELESMRHRSLGEFSKAFNVPEVALMDALDEVSGHISLSTLRSLIVCHYWKNLK
jgi:hypothetical protein